MTKPATSAAEPHAVVELVPLDKIAESPTNHRQHSWGDMEDLTASVREHGILQPILVRPKTTIGSNLYEVVFGARRVRAAKGAGLVSIPAMVREMSNEDVIETQVIENLHREGVHPLEEAEGYEQLLHAKDRKYDVEEIAAKVGKSRGYVYGRMKLLALCKVLREAFYAGKFTASSALTVARVTDHGTQRAILEDLSHYREDGAYPAYDVSRIVRNHLCRLAEAPFSKDDPALVSGAGPCSLCPKRSGAQPELFADVAKQDGDLCIDPVCFQKKKEAAWEKRAVEAQAKGLTVVDGKAAEKVLRGNDHLRLDQTYYQDPKYRTLKQLVGRVAKDRILLARDEDGEVRELVPKAEVKKLLKEAGHNFRAERAGGSVPPRASKAAIKKAKEEGALRKAVDDRILVLFLERCQATEPDKKVWRRVVDELVQVEDGLLGARWPALAGQYGYIQDQKKLDAELERLTEKELRGLAIALALSSSLNPHVKARGELLRSVGIDPKKVEAEVKVQREKASAEAARPIKWTDGTEIPGTETGLRKRNPALVQVLKAADGFRDEPEDDEPEEPDA